jgi:5-methylcytosine-specific restriction enzyme A
VRYCLHAGCTTIVPRGFCATHGRKENDRPNPQERQWYHSPRWAALRAWKLSTAPDCETCALAGRTEAATDVDHRTPHRGRADLFWNPANLSSLCHRCHARKTRSEQLLKT